MRKAVLFVGVLFCVNGSAMTGEPAHTSPYIGKDLQLYVYDKPFFIRGMAYAPEPAGFPGNHLTSGNQPVSPWQFKEGAWICAAANQYARDDWQSPCLDDDLFGLLNPDQTQYNRNTQYNTAIELKWDRDLSSMQKMGVNTLRLYNVNGLGKNHLPFLSAAQKKGIYVIFPLLTNHSAREVDPFPEKQIEALVRETCPGGNLNPAILAYTAGNELTPIENPEDKRRISRTIDIAKSMCPQALVTYAHNDVPKDWILENGKSPLMEEFPKLDFLTINEYRNSADTGDIQAYHDFFYTYIKPLTEKYNKPFLIGETGEHQNDTYRPYWFNHEWQFILDNSKPVHNLGAVFFEYNDEPIKKSKSGDSNDAYMGIVSAGWPSKDKKNEFIDVPDINKTFNYKGIADFTDTNGHKITFEGSSKGAGRYEMFVNDNKGIGACSFAGSPDPEHISEECKKAKWTP